MQRADSLEKTLMVGEIKGKRRRGRQRMRWLDSITGSMDMNLSKLGDSERREPGRLQSVGLQRVRHDLATGQHNKWCSLALWKVTHVKLQYGSG